MTVEVLKLVFPLLDGVDLASCMVVCKQWRGIVEDDYLWKCLCARRWPSLCQRPSPSVPFFKLYRSFYKRQRRQGIPPPRLSFSDLDFYIDIWAEAELIFSTIISGPVLTDGILDLPTGISDILRARVEGPACKLMFPVNPTFPVHVGQKATVSMLIGRKDSNKFACLINKAVFDYVDRTSFRALAFDYLDFSPSHPFISGIRAWVSLLFTDKGTDEVADVCGIEVDFCDAANNDKEILWLLDMLDWK